MGRQTHAAPGRRRGVRTRQDRSPGGGQGVRRRRSAARLIPGCRRRAGRSAGGSSKATYTSAAMKFFSRFVDSNDRELRRLQPIVDEANELEDEIAALSDEEIRTRFDEIRDEIREVAEPDEPSDDELHHPDLER